MTDSNLLDCLTLYHADGLPPSLLREYLLKARPEHAFACPPGSACLGGEGAGALIAKALQCVQARACAESALRWLDFPDNAILTLADERYPHLLREIADPPPVLFVRGNLRALSVPQIAVVGSRRSTVDGRDTTANFVSEIVRQGLSVCSGLATGIDTAAHKAALDAGGITVGVVGTGVDLIYPRNNALLAARILENGALVSEFPLGYPPLPANFPRRNRIISGVSVGVLVVEAALQSGSLITARMAMEQNREVFAVPGSIRNPLSRGCHKLIREGATLADSPQDLWENLAAMLSLSVQQQEGCCDSSLDLANCDTASNYLSDSHKRLVAAIGYDPVPLEALVTRTNMPVMQLQSALLALELDGVIRVESGRYAVQRVVPLQGH